jgi:hypothetical protein
VSLGALLEIAQIFAFFDLRGGSAIDRAMTCAALGVPFWLSSTLVFSHWSEDGRHNGQLRK